MGLGAATGGTIVGFIFAYALVRCSMPFSRGVHVVTLLPTISPPFAIAIAAILLFGRNGLITRQILGIRFGPGGNDIYGLDGLIFVQIITFFPVAYLIIRAMLERIDASMEEAALSLGASKFHIFRTVTLPLLAPGHRRVVPAALCRIAGRPGQPAADRRQRHGALGRDLPCGRRPVRPAEGGVALGDPADPDADALPAPALLYRAPLLHRRDRQAHDRAHLCQGARHPLDLYRAHAPHAGPGAAALLLDPGGVVYQAVGHRQPAGADQLRRRALRAASTRCCPPPSYPPWPRRWPG